MTAPEPIPVGNHDDPGGFLDAIEDRHLVYFLLNVGDGDQQAVLLPRDPSGERKLVIVDAARKHKTEALIATLEAAGLVAPAAPVDGRPDGSIALVVATHPHSDHIGGIASILDTQRGRVAEFWDPGYFHPIQAYHQMMAQVETNAFLSYAQPTAGYKKWVGSALITVLAPSVMLRNRFDTYGTEINDASITLRIEFPAARVVNRGGNRELIENPRTTSLVLGGDAQSTSWAFVETEFPELHKTGNAASRAIADAVGRDPLDTHALKVSHHGSKHGTNLELVTRMSPTFNLVSSTADGPKHHFPHDIAQNALREAADPIAGSGAARGLADWQLRILYTGDTEDDGTGLGSIALVMASQRASVWRFGDAPGDDVDLGAARRFRG